MPWLAEPGGARRQLPPHFWTWGGNQYKMPPFSLKNGKNTPDEASKSIKKKTQNREFDPTGTAYSAPPNSLADGEGKVPPPKNPSPLSASLFGPAGLTTRPFGSRLCPPHPPPCPLLVYLLTTVSNKHWNIARLHDSRIISFACESLLLHSSTGRQNDIIIGLPRALKSMSPYFINFLPVLFQFSNSFLF